MKVGQTFLSARIDSVLSVPLYVRSVRANVFTLFHRQDNRTDGRFFAALRMTCYAIAIVEVYSSCVGPDFHAEKAGAKVGPACLPKRHWQAQAGGHSRLPASPAFCRKGDTR